MRNALHMMKYIPYHSDEFDLPGVGWTFAFLNFWTTFVIELSCIAKMCTQNSFLNTLTSFITYMIINALPDYSWGVLYANSTIKTAPAPPIQIKVRRRNNPELSCGSKAMRLGYKMTRVLYGGYIFYFLPFMSIVLPFWVIRHKQ
jgi:hypothetical protein